MNNAFVTIAERKGVRLECASGEWGEKPVCPYCSQPLILHLDVDLPWVSCRKMLVCKKSGWALSREELLEVLIQEESYLQKTNKGFSFKLFAFRRMIKILKKATSPDYHQIKKETLYQKITWLFTSKVDALQTQEEINALTPIFFEEDEEVITAYRDFNSFQDRLLSETLPTDSTCCYDSNGYEIPLEWVKKQGSSYKGITRAKKQGKKNAPRHHYTLGIQNKPRRYKAKELKNKISDYLTDKHGIQVEKSASLEFCINRLIKLEGMH